jgi:hypothetical protein
MAHYNNIINEINRYNFIYEDTKQKIEYNLPHNEKILKEEQNFLNLRKIYKNTPEFRDYFNKWYDDGEEKYRDKMINIKRIHFDSLNIENSKNVFIIDQDTETDEKNDTIRAQNFNYNEYKNLTHKEQIDYQFEPIKKKIKYMINHLNDDGYFFMNFLGFDSKIIKLIHLLLLLFDRVLIKRPRLTYALFCFNYNPIIYKDDFLKLLVNIESLKIEPLIDLEKLSKEIYNRLFYLTEIVNTIKTNNLKKYYSIVYKFHINNYIDIQYANENNQLNSQLEQDIYNIININHLPIKNNYIDSYILPIEGNKLYNLIITNKLNKCIQIGMEYGITTIYILLGLNKLKLKSNLITIDEYQKSRWNNFGIKLVELNNLTKLYSFYEEPSYIALPKLLEKDTYNMVFINGWNTFDYILLCIAYASILLDVDGFLILNNKYSSTVNKCIKYIDNNYSNMTKIETENELIIYKKNNNNLREIDFFSDF